MSTCPPLLLPAPPPTEPFVGGLFAAASFPDPPDAPWECGIQYESETCAKPRGWHADCDVPREDKVADLAFPLVEGRPFQVILGVQCPLVGYTLNEFERRVRQAFVLCEQRAVEEIFMTSSEENNGLAGTVEEPSECFVPPGATTAAPLSVAAGVAAIEKYMRSEYCGTPVLHAPVDVATFAATHNLVIGNVGRQTTPLGSRWAFGGGYAANVGPDGVAAPEGVAWLYGTGAVNIWRSEAWTNPDKLEYAFNTRTNDSLVFVERTYVITTECACIAVPVELSCSC